MSEEQPCLGVCFTDPESGVCLGCGRTPEEISGSDTAPACDLTGKENAQYNTHGKPTDDKPGATAEDAEQTE